MSDRTTSEIAVRNRMAIPLFRAGKDGPSLWSAQAHNVIVRALLALTNPSIVWGEKDDARITDGNFLIQLSRASAEATGRITQYVLTDASNGDYFICRTISRTIDDTDPENPVVVITTGDQDIYIAKPFHLRRSPFDRDVLNSEAPGNIGTVDEIAYETVVESWDGVTFSSATKRWSYEYKSATFRIATDETAEDPDDWTSENQTVIPRFVPNTATSPTIIYAVQCEGLGITYLDGGNTVDIELMSLSDGWAWARTS